MTAAGSGGRPSWLEDLEVWLLAKGNMSGPRERRRPGLPMKRSHVKNQTHRIKRLLTRTSPPFLEVVGSEGKRFVYKVLHDVRELRPEHVAGAIDVLFPGGATPDVALSHREYVHAGLLLGRYLAFGLQYRGRGVWRDEDLRKLSELCPVRRVKLKKLEVIPPARFDAFLEWLRPRRPEHWATMWAMRHIGFRWEGVIGARRDMRSGTFVVRRGQWTINEKVYERQFRVPEHVATFLAEWEAELGRLHPETEWLFPSSRGEQWSESTSSWNKVMRKLWTEWLVNTGQPVNREELELVHAHMCRHICATYLASQRGERSVPPAVIQEYLGHQDLKTTQRYINIASDFQGSFIDDAHRNGNGTVPAAAGKPSALELLREVLGGMSKDEKRAAALELMKEAMA